MIRKLFQKHKFHLLVLGAAAATTVLWEINSKEDNPKQRTEENFTTADTFVPSGFALVPIEVVNFQALDPVLGQHGVVDLYTAPTEHQHKPILLARRIRILRAPKNPNQFAVLSPESQVKKLFQGGGRFYVAVQNPKTNGTIFEKQKTKINRIRVFKGEE